MKAAAGIFTLCALIFALCSSADAQPKKLYRLGYLAPQNAAGESARADAVRRALRELGYVEGQNLVTEYRYAEGKTDRFPEVSRFCPST